MLVRIHHLQVTIPKGAETQGKEYYCDFLGLQEIPKPANMLARGGFWLQIGDQELHIGVEDNAHRRETKAHVAYEVDDLEDWRSRLHERDIEPDTGGPELPGYNRLKFRDPWGNMIELLQRSR